MPEARPRIILPPGVAIDPALMQRLAVDFDVIDANSAIGFAQSRQWLRSEPLDGHALTDPASGARYALLDGIPDHLALGREPAGRL